MRIPFFNRAAGTIALEPLKIADSPAVVAAASRGFRAALDRRRIRRSLLEQDTVFGFAGARDRAGRRPARSASCWRGWRPARREILTARGGALASPRRGWAGS